MREAKLEIFIKVRIFLSRITGRCIAEEARTQTENVLNEYERPPVELARTYTAHGRGQTSTPELRPDSKSLYCDIPDLDVEKAI